MTRRSRRTDITRMVYLGLGWLSLALGGIGILLPLLPTTPFVILAAFCFARSSPALAQRLERHRTFGPIIADWRRNGAIAPPYKAIALGMMAAALGLSVALHSPVMVIVIQIVAMAAAAAFILTRPNGPRR